MVLDDSHLKTLWFFSSGYNYFGFKYINLKSFFGDSSPFSSFIKTKFACALPFVIKCIYLWALKKSPMQESAHIHYKLFKPYGMLSQLSSNNPKELRSKLFLSSLFDFPKVTMPIGRLDEKSEGLLLMTTDGKLSDTINRSGIEKEYYAQLDGSITQEALDALQKGVEIGFEGKKYITKPCTVNAIATPDLPKPDRRIRLGRHRPNSWIRIVLTEGKFRQVRKMTAAVGYPTLRLVRVRIGKITLDNMSPSEVVPIKL